MSNEKQINHTHWKAGLDELAMLPGEEPFNTDTAWQKLELRKSEKKGNKKIFFYWMAAASVLTCIMLFGISLDSKKDIPVPTPIVLNNIPVEIKEPRHTFRVDEKKEVVLIDQNKKSKILTYPVTDNSKNKEIVITKRDVVMDVPVIKEDSAEINAIAVQTNQSKPVVFPSLRKKIPVVHINELEKQIDPVQAVAGNTERLSLKSRFFNRQAFQESEPAPNQGGTILIIKLSPQN